jgi:FKBP-type peptidyl-prolyl cis-trans isomerase SlyD
MMAADSVIEKDKVVSINYVLKDNKGTIMDSSQGQPLSYLQGHNNIIPGLEQALLGLKVGEQKQVQIAPQDGYGELNPELRFTIPLDQFGEQAPQPGMMVQLNTDRGENFMATVLKVENGEVFMDGNHPLAGQELFFDIQVTEIRNASQEELTHGHPHGPGGHHH